MAHRMRVQTGKCRARLATPRRGPLRGALQQPARLRSDDLYRWLNKFDAIGQAIQLILKLTRESTMLKPALASGGVYQEALNANLPYQLVRIALPADAPYFAELSGGRHRFTARFLRFSTLEDRARQTDRDVEFELACCLICS